MMTSITIGGLSATGTSSAAKALAQRLGWGKSLSAGDMMRDHATKAGFSTIDAYLHSLPPRDNSVDEIIDSWIRGLTELTEPFVLESRLGWYFHPRSFKGLLVCPDIIRGQRALTRDGEKYGYHTVEEALAGIDGRDEKDLCRFNRLYRIGRLDDREKFDIVINSHINNPSMIAEIIVDAMKKQHLLSTS